MQINCHLLLKIFVYIINSNLSFAQLMGIIYLINNYNLYLEIFFDINNISFIKLPILNLLYSSWEVNTVTLHWTKLWRKLHSIISFLFLSRKYFWAPNAVLWCYMSYLSGYVPSVRISLSITCKIKYKLILLFPPVLLFIYLLNYYCFIFVYF